MRDNIDTFHKGITSISQTSMFFISTIALTICVIAPFMACTQPTTAHMVANTNNGQVPLTIIFTNESKNADQFQWDFGDGTSMTTTDINESVSYVYTKSGDYVVTLTATKKTDPTLTSVATTSISVTHGNLESVEISPTVTELNIGDSQQFDVIAMDEYGNPITGIHIAWQVEGGIGSVSGDGMFTAGTQPGTYEKAIIAEITFDGIKKSITSSITIRPNPVKYILLEPAEATTEITDDLQIMATALDEFGNALPDITSNWSVVSGGGKIDSNGAFTPEILGTSTIRFTATEGGQTVSSDVKVTIKPKLMSVFGGSTHAVAYAHVGGTPFAFFGCGPFVKAADISDPTRPLEVGRLLLPGLVKSLVFRESDQLLFVANDNEGGLRIIDVSNPSSLVEIGFLDTSGLASDVFISNDLAFVADGGLWGSPSNNNWLRIIDISNPTNPIEISSHETSGTALGIIVSENLAFIPAHSGGLDIIDVSNPKTPCLVSSLEMPGYARGLSVSGDKVYIAAAQGGLRIVDISDPLKPKELGFLDVEGDAQSVHVVDHFAYVANFAGNCYPWDPQLHIIDISNPNNPVVVRSLQTTSISFDMSISGNIAIVSNDSDGFCIMDISNPSYPQQLGSLDTYGGVYDVHVLDNIAYIVQTSCLRMLDVSDPSSPVPLGLFNIVKSDHPRRNVFVTGKTAYLATPQGLYILDVSDPSTPRDLGFIEIYGSNDVFVLNDLAYITDGSKLYIVDVSNPSRSKIIGYVTTPGYCYCVFIDDGTAYVADGRSGFHIIDVSAPENPVIVGSLATTEARKVYITGKNALIADGVSLIVVDISDPSRLSEIKVGKMWARGAALAIFASGNTVVVGTAYHGLHIADISDPYEIMELDHFETAGSIRNVYISDGYAFIADGESLLIVAVAR